MTFKAAHSIPVDKSVPKNDCCDQTCLVGNTFHLLQDVTSYIYENLPLTQASIWASARHLWWSRFTRGGTEVVAPFSFWPLGRLLLRKSGDISKISSFLPSGFKYDKNRFSGCPTLSFWNHSIKKWSCSPFIISDDNIICFIAFLDVFSTKIWLAKKFRTTGPPPYLGQSPKFYHFLWLP